MKKLDAILAALIGFLNGVFLWLILGQMEIEIPFAFLLPIVFAPLGAFGLYIADLIGKKILIIFQAAKFFLVGTLNTFIDIGVLNLLIWIFEIKRGKIYSLFKATSFLVATTNSYFWNKYWTFGRLASFEKRKEKPTTGEFLKFLIVTAIGLGINVGVASFAVNKIGPQFGISEKIWAGAIGPVIAAFFAFVWNFLSSKFIVFKK
jgi:putative flippase GtrA